MDKEIILEWLYGDGDGYGSGSGSGDGYGSGDGDGYGSGDGDGYGSGYGYGSGDGDGDGSGYGYGSGDGYGDGYGSGYGSGYGYGSGDGDGDGYGSGYGSGRGSGSGSGDGSGYGYKIQKYKLEYVFYIDHVPTIIRKIKGDYACGFVINDDFSLTKCWIARDFSRGLFAHGRTLRDAVESLNKKIEESMSEEERINLFCTSFKNNKKYKGTIFFDWHNRLTGSCLFGRNQFVKNKDLDLNALYSVDDFIAIVENDYGSDIIKALKEKWNSKEV